MANASRKRLQAYLQILQEPHHHGLINVQLKDPMTCEIHCIVIAAMLGISTGLYNTCVVACLCRMCPSLCTHCRVLDRVRGHEHNYM